MKIFKLYCKEHQGWDATHGYVVRSKDEASARQFCYDQTSNSDGTPKSVWLDPAQSTCELVKSSGKQEVILYDYLAG